MIYADYNASMPICSDVKNYLINRFNSDFFGNPNALHTIGRNLNQNIKISRMVCAEILNADAENIIFNSGSTESIYNIFNLIMNYSSTKKIIIISEIEHDAVNKCSNFLEKNGFNIIKIPVNKHGVVDTIFFEKILKEKHKEIALVSIMAANNETGVIQPTNIISKLCNEYSVLFFSDTCQLIGKEEFNFKQSGFDFACISGHKIGALTGIGILLVKNPHHYRQICSDNYNIDFHLGTPNYIGIETMAIALKSFYKNKNKIHTLKILKQNFENKLKQKFKNLVIAGENSERICNTTLISYPGLHSQVIQIELESKNIYITTTAACKDNEPNPSHVLKAMGYTDNISRGMIRISTGFNFTSKEYDDIFSALNEIYIKLTKINFNEDLYLI